MLDPFAFSGTLSSGSPTVTGINTNNFAILAVGDTVTGTGIPSGTTILSVNSSTDTIKLSANATASGPQSLRSLSPDLISGSLVPVPGDYDNATYFADGDANWMITEAAVYDPVAGVYTILGPGGTTYTVTGFQPGDIPAPADYLGDGSTQPVVFRPSTGQFIGADGVVIATFGQSGNIPLAAPLSYRMPSSDPPSGTTGSGTTGSSTTGSGTTGSSTTGSGTTGSATTGSSTTGSGTTGNSSGNTTGSSTSGTGGNSTRSTPPPAQSPGSGATKPVTVTHKKKVAKPKPKPVVHKKAAAPKKAKTVKHAVAPKPKVHVVAHKITKVVVKTASSAKPNSKANLVDLALEDMHTNLRRSSEE